MGYNSVQYLLQSTSTVANYIAWASAISAQMAACGWLQTNDTGQVVWQTTTVAITQASGDGTTATYTYSLTGGPALRIGMSVVIAGCTTAGLNGTFNITALGGSTFGVANTTVATESEIATGTVAATTSVPGSTTTHYEVWSPNDSLQTGGSEFFVRFGYGLTNRCYLDVTLCTATDGAGVATGLTTVTQVFNSTTQQTGISDCYFCGAPGRLSFVLFRGLNFIAGTASLVIERTKNADGTDNTDGVYMTVAGPWCYEGTLVFGVGPSDTGANIPWSIVLLNGLSTGTLFNNSVALRPIFPVYGKIGYPIAGQMFISATEATEGTFVLTNFYGSQRTYLVSGSGNLGWNGLKRLTRFD